MEIKKRIKKYNSGSYTETYHKKGDETYWHREDGPARIEYNKDGSIQYESYWVNNKLHREDGPAWIWYNKDSSIQREEYCIDNNYSTKEEWEQEYGWKLKLKGTPMGEIYGN